VAASSGSEATNDDGDPLRESRAYSQSVLFMVAMPYLLLGAIGVYFYRCYRAAQKQAGALAELVPQAAPPAPLL
jgi:hypothetical protein